MTDIYRQAYSINHGTERQITIKLSLDLWGRWDNAARSRNLARSVMMRRLLEGALSDPEACERLLKLGKERGG